MFQFPEREKGEGGSGGGGGGGAKYNSRQKTLSYYLIVKTQEHW